MKEQLLQLIETYAASRPTANAMLQRFAAEQLSAFLDTVEVIAKQPAEPTPEAE